MLRPAGLPHGDAVEVLGPAGPATWYRATSRAMPPPALRIPRLPTRSLQVDQVGVRPGTL